MGLYTAMLQCLWYLCAHTLWPWRTLFFSGTGLLFLLTDLESLVYTKFMVFITVHHHLLCQLPCLSASISSSMSCNKNCGQISCINKPFKLTPYTSTICSFLTVHVTANLSIYLSILNAHSAKFPCVWIVLPIEKTRLFKTSIMCVCIFSIILFFRHDGSSIIELTTLLEMLIVMLPWRYYVIQRPACEYSSVLSYIIIHFKASASSLLSFMVLLHELENKGNSLRSYFCPHCKHYYSPLFNSCILQKQWQICFSNDTLSNWNKKRFAFYCLLLNIIITCYLGLHCRALKSFFAFISWAALGATQTPQKWIRLCTFLFE